MLYCGKLKNLWVETALRYLPDDVFEKINGGIAFTVLSGDACRLATKICNKEEIIILSPWIFYYIPAGSSEADKEWRYFIFCILHEVAHAVLKHYPPDELSGQENKDQEDEADRYALTWYNSYALDHSNKGLIPLVIEEVREIQESYQKKRESTLSCG